MRPALLLLAALLLLLAAPPAAQAQESDQELTFEIDEVPAIYQDAPTAEEDATASPAIGDDMEALRQIYPEDPLFETKLRLERHLGVYLIRYPQRDESERVEINKRDVDASIWVSIGSREENDLACKMVRWLVFGRTTWARGARGVFSDFQDLNALTLRFVNVRLRDNKRGRVKKQVHEVMEATLTRRDFEKLKLEEVQDDLNQERCVDAARKHLSRYVFHTKYFDAFKAQQ